jgi:hypothetical protein
MTVPPVVAELVERFQRDIAAYRSPYYNEAQTRQEFIDPFFQALGWDMSNAQGAPVTYREVVHEDAIKISGKSKAPDYSFRVGGARKFFVEAKKPSVNLEEDNQPAYQLRRYAWSSNLPVSIVTDFEEFAVYDCRAIPGKTDSALAARLFYFPYTQYEERWDDIAALFSKDAVLAGSLDEYAGMLKTKRGSIAVDDAFLDEIESWRDLLAHDLARNNPLLRQRDLNFAVQMTINRVIFLRICEDRGVEPYGRLKDISTGASAYERLCYLFRQADDRYNSGLFHFRKEKGRLESPDDLTLSLTISDDPLRKIIKNLYYPDSPYEFSVLPADILGQVYEQFLGRVIVLSSDHTVRIEEKPEVKKAGGIYYTPTFVVDYIVRHTLGELFTGKTYRQVSNLKILDPACGSGSFLIVAYQYLLDWHRDQYIAAGKSRPKNRVYQGPGGEWMLTTDERKRILLNNIYGVDIDTQAVETTKLSLLLKVLEGETSQSLNTQLQLLQERALPDLANNIKCGNSLVQSDFYAHTQLALLDQDQRSGVNVFDWASEFPKIMAGGGFDTVIGNPPYGASLSQPEVDYLLTNFTFQQYQLDTYLLFFEKGLRLLRSAGLFGMIIPNTWLLNLQSDRIRKHIFSQTQIQHIVHYLYRVFPKVTVDTEVVILNNQPPKKTHSAEITVVAKDKTESDYLIPQGRWQAGNGAPVNLFERPEFVMLADKLRKHPKLDEVCLTTQGAKPFQVGKGRPRQTRKIVDEKPFIAIVARDATFKPLLRGSLIQRYRTIWNNDYWISFGDWLAEPRYSAKYDAVPKIVIRQTGDSLVATLDRERFIVRDNLYTITARQQGMDLRFVLALVNSKLLNWFYQRIINPEKGEALAQVKRGHIAQLPIISPETPSQKAQHEQLIELVEVALLLNKQWVSARTNQEKRMIEYQITATERRIDQLVYRLYGLTLDEIEMVES